MKRDAAAKQKGKGKFEPPLDAFFHKLPRLAEGLCDLFWEDGSPREPWTLSINWSGPMPTVQVNDKEEERSSATTAATVQEALEAIEQLLVAGGLPWRYWGKRKKR